MRMMASPAAAAAIQADALDVDRADDDQRAQAGGRPETVRCAVCGQLTGSLVTTELKVSTA
jgi:hypothetical protein